MNICSAKEYPASARNRERVLKLYNSNFEKCFLRFRITIFRSKKKNQLNQS